MRFILLLALTACLSPSQSPAVLAEVAEAVAVVSRDPELRAGAGLAAPALRRIADRMAALEGQEEALTREELRAVLGDDLSIGRLLGLAAANPRGEESFEEWALRIMVMALSDD